MHKLSNRELATVLAALRYWRQDLDADAEDEEGIGPISPHFTEHQPLSVEQIDELCERLNSGMPDAAKGKYVLYDHDIRQLAATTVYKIYESAAAEADRRNNTIVVRLDFEDPIDDDDSPEDVPLGADQNDVCECQRPGTFCSGVPGILAQVSNGRLLEGAKVERCDICQRYETDEGALARLRELGKA